MWFPKFAAEPCRSFVEARQGSAGLGKARPGSAGLGTPRGVSGVWGSAELGGARQARSGGGLGPRGNALGGCIGVFGGRIGNPVGVLGTQRVYRGPAGQRLRGLEETLLRVSWVRVCVLGTRRVYWEPGGVHWEPRGVYWEPRGVYREPRWGVLGTPRVVLGTWGSARLGRARQEARQGARQGARPGARPWLGRALRGFGRGSGKCRAVLGRGSAGARLRAVWQGSTQS